jgi:putative transposase
MGKDDKLVRLKPMLERIEDWEACLSNIDICGNTNMIKQHTRTGRPLGSVEFIQKLEAVQSAVFLLLYSAAFFMSL